MKGDGSSDEEEEKDSRILSDFVENVKKQTVIFTNAKPSNIFTFIKSRLAEKDIKAKESDSKWKLTFTMEEKVEESE